MTRTDFTLAELTAVTGSKRRTVQLWAEAGAIQAYADTERAGTGVHRRFSRDEAMIACMLSSMSYLKMSIGELVQRAADFRTWLDRDAVRGEIEDCIAGKREIIVFFWRCEEYPDHPIRVYVSKPGAPLEGDTAFFAEQILRAASKPQALMICVPLSERLRSLE
jgi:hypothetical protein